MKNRQSRQSPVPEFRWAIVHRLLQTMQSTCRKGKEGNEVLRSEPVTVADDSGRLRRTRPLVAAPGRWSLPLSLPLAPESGHGRTVRFTDFDAPISQPRSPRLPPLTMFGTRRGTQTVRPQPKIVRDGTPAIA